MDDGEGLRPCARASCLGHQFVILREVAGSNSAEALPRLVSSMQDQRLLRQPGVASDELLHLVFGRLAARQFLHAFAEVLR